MTNEIINESNPEIILGVALLVINKETDSRIIFQLPKPNRHHHLFQVRSKHFNFDIPCEHYWDMHTEIEGFYSNKAEFLSRESALEVADKANQIVNKTNPQDELFSEDLW